MLMVLITIAAPLSAASRSSAAPAKPSILARDQMYAQTLIQAGLIEGTIDYPTSLLDRAYALFGDSRLPSDVAGAGSVGEDHGFFLEARKNWTKLPSDIREALVPFTVRPTDTRSRFFQSDDATPTGNEPTDETFTISKEEGECQDTWVWRNGPQYPYKLWMHCTGNYDEDFDSAIALIDSFWEEEVAIMGDPLEDGGSTEQGGDSRIDFYFVDDEADSAPRRGGIGIEESVAAFASAEEPVVGKASSAFVVARRPFIGNPQLSLTLSHEFFHVLQYAHNWEIGFGFKGTPYTSDFDILSFVEAWFVEASADWMKSYIWRDRLSAEDMQSYLHYRFTQYFQGVDVSLVLSTAQSSTLLSHSYASYVYFLFLEQRLGPDAIGDFWRDLEDVEADDFDRMTEILDEQLAFKENFRDFAVQNFNLDLQPGDPIIPRYQEVDPTFPLEAPSLNFARGQNGRLPLIVASDDEPKVYEKTIHNLSAHYYYFTPDKDADYVTFDFTGMGPSDFIDIDLLVKVRDGDWERRQYDPTEPITFCRNDPDDDIEYVYAIVSNHAIYDRQTVEGTFTAGAFSGDCP